MKPTLVLLYAFVTTMTTSLVALAWDGPTLWYEPANAGPGGGGLITTGGALDHNVTCAHCHDKGDGSQGYGVIGADVSFNPPIGAAYKKGQRYEVTVALTGEHLALSGCMNDYPVNRNGFAASFEDDSGKVVGSLSAAFGDAASCVRAAPDPFPKVTTWTYGDCHAVMGVSDGLLGEPATWTFSWTAPSDGSTVSMYYGVVDGNCMMDSMGDDVKVGTKKLGAGVALREVAPNGNPTLACAGLFPLLGLMGALRRRRAGPPARAIHSPTERPK
jgi:hypothetical protein